MKPILTMRSAVESHAQKSLQQFVAEFLDHKPTIETLREDGLYRHYRIAIPGTDLSVYSVVTWPNFVAVHDETHMGSTTMLFQTEFEFPAAGGMTKDPDAFSIVRGINLLESLVNLSFHLQHPEAEGEIQPGMIWDRERYAEAILKEVQRQQKTDYLLSESTHIEALIAAVQDNDIRETLRRLDSQRMKGWQTDIIEAVPLDDFIVFEEQFLRAVAVLHWLVRRTSMRAI